MGSSGLIFLMRGMRPGIWGSSRTVEYLPIEPKTDESHIDTTWSKRTSFSSPTQAILEDLGIKSVFCLLGQAKVRRSHSLEDVVVVFGSAEDARWWVRNVPDMLTMLKYHNSMIEYKRNKPSNVKCSQEPNQGMTHLMRKIRPGSYLCSKVTYECYTTCR